MHSEAFVPSLLIFFKEHWEE